MGFNSGFKGLTKFINSLWRIQNLPVINDISHRSLIHSLVVYVRLHLECTRKPQWFSTTPNNPPPYTPMHDSCRA